MKKLFAIFALVAAATFAQQIDVTVGGSVVHFKKLPKSTVTFGFSAGPAVSISTSRMPAAAVQFDILYPASVTALTVTAGPAATAAGKSIACNLVSAGDTRCIVSAANQNLILNGVVANISATANAPSTLTLSGAVASSVAGGGLTTTISQATTTVSPALAIQGTLCVIPPYDSGNGNPVGTYSIEPGESTNCTATLNQIAPTGGYTGTISASAAGLTLPASTAIAGGQTSAQFTVTGQ